MNKHTSKITTKSIEQSGLPNDYKKALAEYIWNGFDAGATKIHLDFEANELGHLASFSISDNGTGIDIETIDDTFGNFLDSRKRDLDNQEGFQKGRKGKGRYAFSTFANSCSWLTTFKGPDGTLLRYTIAINKGDLQNFIISDRVIVKKIPTGTVVNFQNVFDLSASMLSNKEFEGYLSSEFGWFLFLNKERGCKIFINGVELAYENIIGDTEEVRYEIGDYHFKAIFIRWNQKIGDRYYFYFLGKNQKEAGKKHTSFNNKAIDFHHSLYVESPFFDNFHETMDDNPVLEFSGKNQTHPSFKALLKALNALVSDKEKQFIRGIQADKLIEDYHGRGIFPDSTVKTDELEKVVKEIYCAEPRVFQSSNNQQSKMIVGLLNLLLLDDNRERVLKVIESIVDLSHEERLRIGQVLGLSAP
ncbi:histidine kinase/DNA gyrase B/HSP90-like ATPase [Arcticibacter pallidicorallinus]|uniref:Histidine kinase/DNA gyrase B/HSP90-like ATPase n=1 Tax=Arcticibacter pallidicorallinus TaxID=1259464 RepID=A0A2T0U410_9SPHI|nr:ATP-binding protein [Arcticibacter pallidicorallinus]PRY52659.1 histidine kinase/DNA gyrase B/HSP90-like ATPase [Arcticibacter pallidicorallinus]